MGFSRQSKTVSLSTMRIKDGRGRSQQGFSSSLQKGESGDDDDDDDVVGTAE